MGRADLISFIPLCLVVMDFYLLTCLVQDEVVLGDDDEDDDEEDV